jgi:pilus assembly protein Flp/PilA
MALTTLKNLFKDEAGATAVEYALLVAVVAVGLVGAMGTLADSINELFNGVSTSVNGALD